MDKSEMVIVQCFYPFSMEFHVSDGIITMPSKAVAPKNVIEMTKAHYDELIEIPTFKDMFDQRLYRLLDKIPNSYYDAVERVSRANLELVAAQEEANRAKADAEAAKKEADRLKKQIEDLGGATVEVDKKVLDAQAERDAALKAAEEASAEIAELKKKLAEKKGK